MATLLVYWPKVTFSRTTPMPSGMWSSPDHKGAAGSFKSPSCVRPIMLVGASVNDRTIVKCDNDNEKLQKISFFSKIIRNFVTKNNPQENDMTKSILTTKSTKMKKSRHNNKKQQYATTGFARRALLLLTFFVACVGSVWGQGTPIGVVSNNEVKINSKEISDEFGSATKLILRVYCDLTSGNIYIASMWYQAFLDTDKYYSWSPEYSGSCLTFELNPSMINQLVTQEGLYVKAENGATLTGVTYEKVDPFIGKPKTNSSTGATPIGVDADDTSKPINLSDALEMVEEAKYQYVRIYLEQGGKAVDPTGKLNVTGGTLDGTHGYYISKSAGDFLTQNDLNGVTLELEKGTFEDYQVVCVFSKDVATELPDKEPDWDLQYIYTFEYPFKGQVTEDTKTMETILKVPVGQKASAFTFFVDYNDSKVKLMRGDDLIASAPISSDFLDYYPSAILTGDFYIRWFLQRSGVEINVANSLADAGNGIYSNPAKNKYYYWSTTKQDGNNDLNEILKINFDASQLSELTDYELVFTIATELEGENYELENLTHEPNTMAYKYTFCFENRPFEAENLSTVKIVYKTALYDASTGTISPDLFTNYSEVMADLLTSEKNFINNGYLRWYITDLEGNIVSDIDDWGFSPNNYIKKDGYGYYLSHGFDVGGWASTPKAYNPTITLPSTYNKSEDYKKYQVVCVITTDRTSEFLPDCEPTNMQVKYVFSQILTNTEIVELPFVHYKGQSGRDWVPGNAGNISQKYWDEATGEIKETIEDIRQGVHTWEYDIYVKPGEKLKLLLPFENYEGSGQNSEPRGYVRWYNWGTDTKLDVADGEFTFTGSYLDDKPRGLFALCPGDGTTITNFDYSEIGVEFKPIENFLKPVDIACDVSKYTDGIVTINSQAYLLHEPTLSNRYIFHIRPAFELAKRLETAKIEMNNAKDADALYYAMSKLEEDKGKVVVSLNGETGTFALRLDQQKLSYYILQNGTDYALADKVQWYAYFENDEGVWRKQVKSVVNGRITDFTLSDFTGSGYKDLSGNNSLTNVDSKKFHVVGYVGYVGNDGYGPDFDVVNGKGIYAPVVHYELHFINAPATPVTSLPKERTDDYMNFYYDQAGIVDFDGNPATNPNVAGHEAEYYSTPKWDDAPTSSADNLGYEPFPWEDIQYGFCYPHLTQTIRNGFEGEMVRAVSPEHGDYIIVKSINLSGISSEMDTSPFKYRWWRKEVLYDYTHTVTDGSKYGSFLYTDASHESRTIAKIPFTANLCSGSSIYFTAVVADMTNETVKPQLLIRIIGVNAKGETERIVAFHTCDISTTGAIEGQWNQIYGVSTVPANFDPGITEFRAEVINYANNTNGADFAIDQIVIYTSTAKVLLTQTGESSCEDADTNNKVQIYMEGEGLQNAFDVSKDPQPIYWRIYDKITGELVTGKGMYPQYKLVDGTIILDNNDTNETERNTYGITYVISDYNAEGVDVKEHPNTPDVYGWYKDKEGNYFFQIANKTFETLIKGREYYVSVHEPCTEEDFPKEQDEGFWGKEKIKCSIYSEFFIPRRQYVTYIVDAESGEEGGELTIGCGGNVAGINNIKMVLKVPDDDATTGFTDYPINFDYAICSMSDWGNPDVKLKDSEYTYQQLALAWYDYRFGSDNSNGHQDVGLVSGYAQENQTHYDILKYATENQLLLLDNSDSFNYTFTKNETNLYHVICLPTTDVVQVDGINQTLCDFFEVIFMVKSSGGPSLELGFNDVTYPSTGYEKRVIRVGMEQLTNLRTKGYMLHVPVKDYQDKDKAKVNKLYFTNEYLTISEVPADPTGSGYTTSTKFAKIVAPNNTDKPYVDADHMYLALNLSGENCGITFHEGYEYEVSTSYYDERDKDNSGRCQGDIYLVIKVVPEFVTWNDETTTENPNINANWNNDENWSRSKRTELYKGTTNTVSKGHPEGYKDNGDLNITTTPAAFVPMKFTYVTIPTKNKAPELVNLTIGNEGIYTNVGNDATSNIQYDMMVRYTEDKCVTADHKEYGDKTKNIYDCEKFYGNWAKEIYFKPEAELVNQHYLTYEKVWVEKKLTAGKWTLMSTPLQNTYAGDMYVPAVAIIDNSLATPESVTGQQVTEAFKEIRFTDQVAKDGQNINLYSRTKYPIYQRSWGKKFDSNVYTQTNDTHRSDYSANLGYDTWSSHVIEWSHTYNDVQVPYSTRKGFAIRAHKSDYNGAPDALLRLPKEDTSYDYYLWDGTTMPNPSTDNVKSVSKSTTGKLFTDRENAIEERVTYGIEYVKANGSKIGTRPSTDNGTVNESVDDTQSVGYYVLVGNPYLCSINMGKFLEVNNSSLAENSYWTYENSTMKAGSAGEVVNPLQSFFVKVNAEATEIKFTPDMMTDGNSQKANNGSRMFALTATNDRGQSVANVSVGEEAKNVETLFDSNLDDVPMVYTVADGQAVSINQVTGLDKPIAFGVTCAANDEPVTVTFSDIEQLTSGEVYVVDAVTGEQTAIAEGSTITVQPNDYGRYFLLAGALNIDGSVNVQQGIVVSMRGRVVTVTSGEVLTEVRALSPDGATAQQATAGSKTASLTLATPGVYIIKAVNVAGEQQTAKVIIR